MKWTAKTEYVDLQTGEVISKSLYEREYYRVRSSKPKYEIKEVIINNEIIKKGVIKYVTECRRKNQTRIW